MKTKGMGTVRIFQPYGIGERIINNTDIEIADGRVEIFGGKFEGAGIAGVHNPIRLNLPQEICTIIWTDEVD